MTNRTCTKYPVLIPGMISKIPKSHTTIQITATNHNKLLITKKIKLYNKNSLIAHLLGSHLLKGISLKMFHL